MLLRSLLGSPQALSRWRPVLLLGSVQGSSCPGAGPCEGPGLRFFLGLVLPGSLMLSEILGLTLCSPRAPPATGRGGATLLPQDVPSSGTPTHTHVMYHTHREEKVTTGLWVSNQTSLLDLKASLCSLAFTLQSLTSCLLPTVGTQARQAGY